MLAAPGLRGVLGLERQRAAPLRNKLLLTTSRIYAAEMPHRKEGASKRARQAQLGCQEMGHKLVLRTTPSTPLLRSPCLLVKGEEEEGPPLSRSSAQVQLCSLGLLWREVGGRLAGMHHSAR